MTTTPTAQEASVALRRLRANVCPRPSDKADYDSVMSDADTVEQFIAASPQPDPPASTVTHAELLAELTPEERAEVEEGTAKLRASTVSAGADAVEAACRAMYAAQHGGLNDGPIYADLTPDMRFHFHDFMRAALDAAFPTLTREVAELRAQVASLVAENERLNNENVGLLGLTLELDQHPDDYDGPCMCKTCQSYGEIDEGEQHG